MNAAMLLMVVLGVGMALARGNLPAVSQAALQGGEAALNTVRGLVGGFLFFGGVMCILERAGAVRALVRLLRRPLRWLFGQDVREDALEAITLNLAANMLGLGNAATPMGLKAAKLLQRAGDINASASLCLLLVINATSVQIMPTTVIALRYAANSAAPEAIVWPSLIASAAATLTGILLCRLCEKMGKKA